MSRADLDTDLKQFLADLFAAIEPALNGPGQNRVFSAGREACVDARITGELTGHRLPVCSCFDTAVRTASSHARTAAVAHSLAALESSLTWYDREDFSGTGSANFPSGHANTFVVGPNGLTERSDVWVGVSLLAPNVRYPDHSHPPEELYLVLSPGDFRNTDTDWQEPGVGGLFHNPPGIVHAMRSTDEPLLAVWTLVPAAV